MKLALTLTAAMIGGVALPTLAFSQALRPDGWAGIEIKYECDRDRFAYQGGYWNNMTCQADDPSAPLASPRPDDDGPDDDDPVDPEDPIDDEEPGGGNGGNPCGGNCGVGVGNGGGNGTGNEGGGVGPKK